MDLESIDKKIDFAERRVLISQARIAEQLEKASGLVKRLEREAKGREEIKKEWIRKKNLEEDRTRMELSEIHKAHRHAIEDLRLKYEKERENKLRELKVLIKEEELVIREWQKKRDEAAMKTRTEEAEIKSRYQVKINAVLREEQSAARRGVVRQKRLLDAPNVFSMEVEKSNPVRMKKRSYQRRII